MVHLDAEGAKSILKAAISSSFSATQKPKTSVS